MPTKVCTWCRKRKPEEKFSIRRDSLRQAHCKTCHSEYHRKHYLANKTKYIGYARARQKRLRRFIVEYKTGKRCTDCKRKYPHYVLQFDHLPGCVKKVHLANIHGRGWSLERIMEEIKKCDLVCANCHAVRTFKRGRRLVVRQQPSKL